MPLPEHEQRQLEQIEQALYREDPKFGRLVRASDPRVHYKRKLAQGLSASSIGAGLLAAGVVTHRLYLEAAGAALAVLSLVWAVVSWRRHVARVRPARPKAARAKAAKGPAGPGAGADQAGPDDGADGRAVALAGRRATAGCSGRVALPAQRAQRPILRRALRAMPGRMTALPRRGAGT